MTLDRKLNVVLREIDRTDMLSEERYTEDEILDMIIDDSEKIEKLSKDNEYLKIIKRLKEGIL